MKEHRVLLSSTEISTDQLGNRVAMGQVVTPPAPPLSTSRARLRNPGIDYKESIPPAYLAGRYVKQGCRTGPQARNRFLGSLKSLQTRAQASRQIFKDDVKWFILRLYICSRTVQYTPRGDLVEVFRNHDRLQQYIICIEIRRQHRTHFPARRGLDNIAAARN